MVRSDRSRSGDELPRGGHAFVDETKRGGLILVAAVVAPRDLSTARALMRGLLLPRQQRLHFTKEGGVRRREIAAAVCRSGARVVVYDATRAREEREARRSCLTSIVGDLAAIRAHRLVIEQDDSLLDSDKRTLRAAVARHRLAEDLVYEHLPPRAEPLLWISDAVAWCWTRSPSWRQRVEPVVHDVRWVE